ncbi:MAG: hypothetical protein HKN33_18055 [Pyrinomonadaceae bacterium]|nr:hypothetical protein [Pyrinomonadaceae bacterium]
MSLLQDEQLEKIEGQGRKRRIYSIEFFATVLISIVVATFVLSRYVPEGTSSIPMVFEAIVFATVLALLASPWAGRLMPVVFVGACAAFVLSKIYSFSDGTAPEPFDSLWVWIFGVVLFIIILAAWKVIGYSSPQNREAREYEKEMRRIGKWQ